MSLAMAGCGTIYSDTYSNKPNHFVPAPHRALIPIIPPPTAVGDTTPLSPAGSSSPTGAPVNPVVLPVADPVPAIPGL